MAKKWKIWVAIVLILGISISLFIMQQIIRVQSQPVMYTEPQAYSITFPRNWHMDGGGQKDGYEILSLYSYDYQKVIDPGAGFNRGQIKISISIITKEAQSLTQIIKAKFSGTEKDFKKEILDINGHHTIRVSGTFVSGDDISPMIETFIDYNEHQYAWLVGYYNGSKKSAEKIKQIEGSFKVLK